MALTRADEEWIDKHIDERAPDIAHRVFSARIITHVNSCPHGRYITWTKGALAGVAVAASVIGFLIGLGLKIAGGQ